MKTTNVTRQVATIARTEITFRTFEGFLSRVRPEMLLEISSESEMLPAITADVLGVRRRPMVAQMSFVSMHVPENLLAQGTRPLVITAQAALLLRATRDIRLFVEKFKLVCSSSFRIKVVGMLTDFIPVRSSFSASTRGIQGEISNHFCQCPTLS